VGERQRQALFFLCFFSLVLMIDIMISASALGQAVSSGKILEKNINSYYDLVSPYYGDDRLPVLDVEISRGFLNKVSAYDSYGNRLSSGDVDWVYASRINPLAGPHYQGLDEQGRFYYLLSEDRDVILVDARPGSLDSLLRQRGFLLVVVMCILLYLEKLFNKEIFGLI